MRKNILTSIAVLGLTGIMAIGCSNDKTSKMTIEELYTKMEEAAKTQDKMSAEMLIDLELIMDMQAEGVDFSVDMAMGMDGTIKTSVDPYKSHLTGTVSISTMGQKQEMDMESYSVIENGNVVNYMYNYLDQSWTRQDTHQTADLYAENNFSTETFMSGDFLKLENKTKKIDGNEVYVVTMKYAGEDLEALMNTMDSSAFMGETGLSMDSLSFEAMEVLATCYVDTDDFQIVQLEMDLEGLGDMMNDLYQDMLASDQSLGSDVEITVDIPIYHIELKNICYDNVTIPDVPQEAKDSAIDIS